MENVKFLCAPRITRYVKRPEQAPKLKDLLNGGLPGWSSETMELAKEYNGRYLHWSDLEYRDVGPDSRETLWTLMNILREGTIRTVEFDDLVIGYNITDNAQRILHDLDVRLSSGLVPSSILDEKRRLMLTVSSIMEESIASSQLEGASTTTKVAKKMLRENTSPRDGSERMIVNNYNAMRFIKEHSGDRLSPDLILEIHSLISCGTLDDARYEGRFRDDNSIAVRDVFTGETYHEPPDFNRIPDLIQALCDFANDDSVFVHPIVKGIVLHFVLAYIHPFMDGNGRVSRTLFYWYLMRNGYSSVEYISISKAMKNHHGRYNSAYLLSETDGNDITYFINYNLDMIFEAADTFLSYVRRKTEENSRTLEDSRTSGLSKRQREVLSDLMNSTEPMDVYELAAKYMIQPSCIRRDIQRLDELGLVKMMRIGHRKAYLYNSRDNFA